MKKIFESFHAAIQAAVELQVEQIYKDIEDDNPGASATDGLTIITEKIQGIVQAMGESNEETGHQQTPEGC